MTIQIKCLNKPLKIKLLLKSRKGILDFDLKAIDEVEENEEDEKPKKGFEIFFY